MKKLVYILVLFCVACGVACCNRYGETEARLVAIDSLVCGQPDSALSLLAGINGDSLPTDLQAYHSLLTVQALYKAYIPATSDTLIHRAWDYYRDHGPYDRRIRAMLYMGTVAEELGHPDSAMRWYKRTELESRPDDHYHRGYALMRQAILYHSKYELKTAVIKFKIAVNEFDKVQNIFYGIRCIESLGAIYRLIDVDSALKYINKGIQLARNNKLDDEYYTLLATLAGLHLYKNNYENALKYSNIVIGNSTDSSDIFSCSHISCEAYCAKGEIDSAINVLKLSHAPHNATDSVIHLQALSQIAKAKNQHSTYRTFIGVSDSIAEDLVVQAKSTSIHNSEVEILNQTNKVVQAQSNKVKAILLLLIMLTIVAGVAQFLYQRKKSRTAIEALKNDLNDYIERVKNQNNIETNQINILKSIEQKLNDHNDVKTIHAIFDAENVDVWEHLKNYANGTYKNIISYIEIHHPQIGEKDLQIVILSCCGFSDKSIKTILDYTNLKSVYNRKRLLPSEKFGINISLADFIEQFRDENGQTPTS